MDSAPFTKVEEADEANPRFLAGSLPFLLRGSHHCSFGDLELRVCLQDCEKCILNNEGLMLALAGKAWGEKPLKLWHGGWPRSWDV